VIFCERPDGSQVSILLNAHVLKDKLGTIKGAVACVQDVSALSGVQAMLLDGDRRSRAWIEALPVAVYATDSDGRVTFYNRAAVDFWGRRPEIGKTMWCGSWQLYWPDGKPMPHDQCPMAVALKEQRSIQGADAQLERPDGTRIRFRAFPVPLWDGAGRTIGALNTLIDVSDLGRAEEFRQQLASIIEFSQDAIIGKDLDGIITSWNHGAEQLFGYTAEEAIGKPVTMLIPTDLLDEEPDILSRIRRGERIEHYETVRRCKNGNLVNISLSISPIKDAPGRVVGASKIAPDITERRRTEEQRQLLLREMNHRVKNLFALAGGVVTLSARSAKTPADLASAVRERLATLARARDLTLPDLSTGALRADAASLHSLIETIVSPFEDMKARDCRVTIDGPHVMIGVSAVTAMALLLHEFATNAAKYGAFSVQSGRVKIDWSIEKQILLFQWEEEGMPSLQVPSDESAGFGTLLARRIVSGQLGGRIWQIWNRGGLSINLSLPARRPFGRNAPKLRLSGTCNAATTLSRA
jgi:PAS domain S-box-containing protein